MLSLFAPAKINLFLHVTGRRADGYHTLQSLIVFADVGDEVRIRPADRLDLSIDGPQAPTLTEDPVENLILRAAKGLQQAAGVSAQARFELTKDLPVASGIGGGSSDAAAAFRLAEALWQSELLPEQRDALLLALGADVPVCYFAKPAVASGIGEILTPLRSLPELSILLVNPRVAVPTGAIFKRLERFDAGLEDPLDALPQDGFGGFIDVLSSCRNSLETPARQVEPVISQVLSAIQELPNCSLSRMSGSGATCFGLFETLDQASHAAQQLRLEQPGWWIESGSVLSARPAICGLVTPAGTDE